MKKLIFTLSLFCLVALQSKAQYCGVSNPSGPNACVPVILTAPGLSPVSDSLAPVVDGVPVNVTIHFQNFDTLDAAGQHLTMDSLHIDSINNLPAGLCWATNKSDNTFAHEENGCIIVTGTTNATPGQYQLSIIVDAYVGFPLLNTSAAVAGLYYYVRVDCSDSVHVRAIDTTGQAEGTNFFVPYDSACSTTYTSIRNVVGDNVQALNVAPNPFNNQTVVSFSSVKTGTMTEKITTIVGSTVYSKQIDVVAGSNSHTIDRNNLAAGIYFYTISDGNASTTKRIVITE